MSETSKYALLFNFIFSCYEAMNKAIEQINPIKDTQIVVASFGSGYAPPEDEAFIDLGYLNI